MSDRSERFLAVLRHGGKDGRLKLLQELPVSSMKDAASFLFTGENQAQQVMALNTLVTAYGFGRAAALAGDLARAAYAFAREVYEQQEPGGPLLPFTVSAIAASGLHAYNLVGQYSECVAFADEVIPQLESLDEGTNLPDVYAHKIEALIGLHRMEDAHRLIGKAEQLQKPSVHLHRLKKTVQEAMGSATKLPPSTPDGAKSMSAEAFQLLSGVLDAGAKFLTKSSGEMNEWEAGSVLRRVGGLFLDPETSRDPATLRGALAELEPILSWARTSGHTDVCNDALWEWYLCQSRLESWSKAADALQALRRNVEKRRAGIANPLERAGAGAKYPHLYPALCQMLHKAGRVEQLLGAIEAAKGRAVADVMAQRANQVIDETEFAEPAARMGELMRRNSAHYLSYLVDQDDALAVLVGKDGTLHASKPIPLGRSRIRSASAHVDPRTWGEPDLADPAGPGVENIAEVLEPLVAWLEPLFKSGVVEVGDHLSYSPDEHLHQFPLAYVRFMGEPLARRLSVSRTHGARALSLTLGRETSRPRGFVSVEVPAREDLADQAMVRQLRVGGEWLRQHLSGTAYRDEKGTLDAIRQEDLSQRVVHFATHGLFPVEGGGRPQNPFEHSGLALAGAHGLPAKGRLAQGEEEECLLTPKRALEAALDLSGSHVTLQACVTGLAREGIGGDALGLDWALLQLGASSLLASHWHVSAGLSAEFFQRFYRAWLERGNSRARAWRETVLGMMDGSGALAEPYAWAAFSLSGDWR